MPEILLVEDNERIASFVVKGLEAHNFHVTHTATGEQALDLATAAEFDLVILDVGLPGIDGFEVLKAFRGQGNEVPVIILTARDPIETTLASFDSGADDYVSKPFSFEELLARVKRRIRSPNEANSESVIVFQDVSLDLLTRRVTFQGKEHDLTAREFTMLEFFLRHPGQVISREQLLSRVWGSSSNSQ